MLLTAALASCIIHSPTTQPLRARHPLVERALADTSFCWQQRKTRHFELYAPADSYAAAHLRDLGELAEKALDANLQLLGSRNYSRFPILLMFASNKTEMKSLVGEAAGGYSEPGEDSAFFVADSTHAAPLRHELMHVVSFGLWGHPAVPEAWVVEGLGTFAPGRCGDYSIDQLAAALGDEGRLVPLDTLLRFTYANTDDVVIYAESASLLAAIHERYGPDGLRQVWQRGLVPALTTLGTTLTSLEATWRARLATIPAGARRVDWDYIRTKGCE